MLTITVLFVLCDNAELQTLSGLPHGIVMSLSRDYLGCRRPSTKALFSLVPVNEKAKNVVQDEDNDHLVSLSLKSRVASFDIGFHINSPFSTNTLATLGRDDCDISLRPSSIARTQCSFEIDDPNTGIIMFYDRSHKRNTRVSGAHSKTFESGRSPRKVLVYPGFNEKISMGGINGELIQFKIEWILTELEIKEIVRKHRDEEKDTMTNPKKARTRDPTETVLTSAIMTPEQAFQRPFQTGLRYLKRDLRGVGSFGRVWRAIDVDSGRVMAMKQIDWVPGSQEQKQVKKVRREVELMRRSKHVRSPSHEILFNADCEVAKYCRLDHIAGLGRRFFLHQDIHESRRGKPRWFQY